MLVAVKKSKHGQPLLHFLPGPLPGKFITSQIVHELLSCVAGFCKAAITPDTVEQYVFVGFFGLAEGMDQRQGQFALDKVVAHLFARCLLITKIIKQIINDLETNTDFPAIGSQGRYLIGSSAAILCVVP